MSDTLEDITLPLSTTPLDTVAMAVVNVLRRHAHAARELPASCRHVALYRSVNTVTELELPEEKLDLVLRALAAFDEQPDLDLTAARASCWVRYDHVDLEGLVRRLTRLRGTTTGVLDAATIR